MIYLFIFSLLITECYFVMFLPGEVTQDELFNRLQQIKDGPEQQNNTAGTESVEDPVGTFDIFLYIVFFFFSHSLTVLLCQNMISHLLILLIFRTTGKLRGSCQW